MMQVLGSVGYPAVYTPTPANEWAYTTLHYNSLPSWIAQPPPPSSSSATSMAGQFTTARATTDPSRASQRFRIPARRSSRLRGALRVPNATSHSTTKRNFYFG